MSFAPCDQGQLAVEETLWLEIGAPWFSTSRCLESHICTPQLCLLCLRTDVLTEGPLHLFFIRIVLYLSVCLGCCACTAWYAHCRGQLWKLVLSYPAVPETELGSRLGSKGLY